MTLYAPVAKDLRFLLMLARINSDLERMGDLAIDICEYGERLTQTRPLLADLSRMSQIVLRGLNETKRRYDVGAINLFEQIERIIQQARLRTGTEDAGIVDQYVDAACGPGRYHQRAAVSPIRDIADKGHHVSQSRQFIAYCVQRS